MKLTWCSAQEDQVLDEFYEEWDQDKSWNMGPLIVRLMERLRAEGPAGWRAYAVTSEAHLYLLAADDKESRRFVRFTGTEKYSGNYYVEFQPPERHNPWPPDAAWIAGSTESEDEAPARTVQPLASPTCERHWRN